MSKLVSGCHCFLRFSELLFFEIRVLSNCHLIMSCKPFDTPLPQDQHFKKMKAFQTKPNISRKWKHFRQKPTFQENESISDKILKAPPQTASHVIMARWCPLGVSTFGGVASRVWWCFVTCSGSGHFLLLSLPDSQTGDDFLGGLMNCLIRQRDAASFTDSQAPASNIHDCLTPGTQRFHLQVPVI